MARKFRIAAAALISASILPVAAPAPAGADPFDAFLILAKRRINPPPLVPTTAPPALQPLNKYLGTAGGRGKSYYLLRITRDLGTPNATVLAIFGGFYRSLAAAKRGESEPDTRAKRTRIRGHKGYQLTSKKRKLNSLVWSENGEIYVVSTGTAKKISLKQLRDAANSLERLEREYLGSTPYDQKLGSSQSAIVITTAKTASVHVDFTGQCTSPDGTAVRPHAGSVQRPLIARQGNSFTIAPTPGDGEGSAWTFSGSGTIGPAAATLSFSASGVFDGNTCATGPVTITLDQRALPY